MLPLFEVLNLTVVVKSKYVMCQLLRNIQSYDYDDNKTRLNSSNFHFILPDFIAVVLDVCSSE